MVFHTLYNYCTVDLSSIYLDIIKDRLYVEKADGARRRSAQTTLYFILSAMVRLMAPVLSFTAEEVWAGFKGRGLRDEESSVHLSSFPDLLQDLPFTSEDRKIWETMLALRQEVSKALEDARAARLIGSSLEAKVIISGPERFLGTVGKIGDAEGFFIVSQLELIPSETVISDSAPVEDEEPLAGVKISVSRALGTKCPRCWIWSADIGSSSDYADLCPRCARVMSEF